MKPSGKAPAPGGLTVIQVIPHLESGGAERSTVEIAEALMAAGGHAIIVTEGGRMATAAQSAGTEVVYLPVASKNPLTILKNAGKIARLARRSGATVIHARSRAPAWSAKIAARKAKIAFVTTYHGVYGAASPLKRWYNSVMAKGDRVIANSAFTAAHVLRAYPGVKSRLVTIGRGVDLLQFDPAKVTDARVARLRAVWGAGAERKVILVPGRLTEWKGQGDVIEAAAIHPELKRALIVLIGDTTSDSYRRALEDKINALGLRTRVRLAGHCADMPAAYLAADVVVQPSRKPEAFGRVAAEALAMGALVVASDIGGASETVIEGTGYRYPVGDVAALGDRLAFALTLPLGARAAMRAAAISHIREHFSRTQMCDATLKVYRDLLERKR